MTDPLTDEERDEALDAIALVRLGLQARASQEIHQTLHLIVGDRDPEEVLNLLWRAADLGALILINWHDTMVAIAGSDAQVPSSEEILDSLIQLLIGIPDEPLSDDS